MSKKRSEILAQKYRDLRDLKNTEYLEFAKILLGDLEDAIEDADKLDTTMSNNKMKAKLFDIMYMHRDELTEEIEEAMLNK